METLNGLESLGWNSFFESQLNDKDTEQFTIARVAIEYKNQYLLFSLAGELMAEPGGSLLYSAESGSALPKVGDWVLVIIYDENKAIIHRLLERKTCLSRKVAGRAVNEQVIAANLDTLFIVQAMDDDFSINRLERYLSIVPEGIMAVIVLNKSDQCGEAEYRTAAVKDRIPHIPVVSFSALHGDVSGLGCYIIPGSTAGFVGSSGVGKSTIVNRLCGQQLLKTREVRSSDSKGRHTTTYRQLILLENGAILMDTPGLRELQLWNSEESIGHAFPEIEALASACRFRDCGHTIEKGCAVLEALEANQLSVEQYRNYLKLRKEEEYLQSSLDFQARLKRKKEAKQAQKWFNRVKRG